MNSNKKIEKAFELAEMFEFMELMDNDKKYILSLMTKEEYNDLRKAIFTLPKYFEKDIDPIINIPQFAHHERKNKFKYLLLYPLQLYKVAAIVIFTYLTYYSYHHINENQDSELIAQSDTVYVHRTDTIFKIAHDTVWIAVEKKHLHKLSMAKNNIIKKEAQQTTYNQNNILPDDVENILEMTNNNSIANDSVFRKIMVLLN